MQGKLRILMLDEDTNWLTSLEMKGVQLEVIQPEKNLLAHHKPPVLPVREVIQMVTSAGSVDVVVLGNNNGAGLWWGNLVDEKMRARTIVVWNYYREGDERAYAPLGFKVFGSRKRLSDIIMKMFPGLVPPPTTP